METLTNGKDELGFRPHPTGTHLLSLGWFFKPVTSRWHDFVEDEPNPQLVEHTMLQFEAENRTARYLEAKNTGWLNRSEDRPFLMFTKANSYAANPSQ